MKITNISDEVKSRITVHAVQLLQDQSFKEKETVTTLSLSPGAMEEMVIPIVVSVSSSLEDVNMFLCIQGGVTLEVCLAPYWSDVSDATISFFLSFHSLYPSTTDLTFVSSITSTSCSLSLVYFSFCIHTHTHTHAFQHSGLSWTRMHVTSSIGSEEVLPEFKLTHHIIPKRYCTLNHLSPNLTS